MSDTKAGIRLAKLATMMNIGADRIPEIIEIKGLEKEVEHERLLHNSLLSENFVRRYLNTKKILKNRLFTDKHLTKIIRQHQYTNTFYTLDDLLEAIELFNMSHPNENVSFHISKSDFVNALQIPEKLATHELLSIDPKLPTYLYIKPNAIIPYEVARKICLYEGQDYDELAKLPLPNYIEPRKIVLEGPKILGKIDVVNQAFNKSNNKYIRLAKAPAIFNVPLEEIVKALEKQNFLISHNPNEKLTPDMIRFLELEFEKSKNKNEEAIRKIIPPQVNNNHETHSTNHTHLEPIIHKFDIKNTKPHKMKQPIQKILFGSPGTGKSYKIVDAEDSYFKQLVIDNKNPDLIKTVFHPEYTYGDFMGKLMPLTDKGHVTYEFYAGHFMQALGTAFKNIIKAYIEYQEKIDEVEKEFKAEIRKNKSEYSEEEKSLLNFRLSTIIRPKPKNVLLVIDEINRGNSAAIFGTAFQLLDRDSTGWSSYPVKISDLELKKLISVIGLYDVKEGKKEDVGTRFCGEIISEKTFDAYLKATTDELEGDKKINLIEKDIKLPPNLSIIATMNTSDNSIYFMDSAFKRRWDWEFIDITSEEQKAKQTDRRLPDGTSWQEFVDNLNMFIKDNGATIRKIEDKQIGYFFIKDKDVTIDAIKNKLLFFLWDSIFNNDKKPLEKLLGGKVKLVTFGDFVRECESFIKAIKGYKQPTE
jgi:5-methylcytosine-specific restriction protein B